MSNRLKHILLITIVVLLNIGCDQQTKQMAVDHFNTPHYLGKSYSYLNNFFKLTFAENEGAFLSWGTDLPPIVHTIFLKVIPVIMLIGMFIYSLFSKKVDRWQGIALAFIIGGGLSNVYDRIAHGKVVDFMNMGIGDLRTGIFNFADVAILVGIGILFVAQYRQKEESVVVE